jgi:hypothetical protein
MATLGRLTPAQSPTVDIKPRRSAPTSAWLDAASAGEVGKDLIDIG